MKLLDFVNRRLAEATKRDEEYKTVEHPTMARVLVCSYDRGRASAFEEVLAVLATGKEIVIDMLLFCPNCNTQHVDKPKGDWENPPHRSHLCASCGWIWRVSDVCTNGVEKIETRGTIDGLADPVEIEQERIKGRQAEYARTEAEKELDGESRSFHYGGHG